MARWRRCVRLRPEWKNEAERSGFIKANYLRVLRPDQLGAVHVLQRAVRAGKDRFLFEMATGTGKILVAAAVIKLFLGSRNASRVGIVDCELSIEDLGFKLRDEQGNSELPPLSALASLICDRMG